MESLADAARRLLAKLDERAKKAVEAYSSTEIQQSDAEVPHSVGDGAGRESAKKPMALNPGQWPAACLGGRGGLVADNDNVAGVLGFIANCQMRPATTNVDSYLTAHGAVFGDAARWDW